MLQGKWEDKPMSKLNEYDINYLIERLQKGEPIAEDFEYKSKRSNT